MPSLNSTNLNLGYNYAQTNQITEIFNWGRTGLTSMAGALKQCTFLTKVATDQTEAFAQVTTFYEAFNHCDILGGNPRRIPRPCRRAKNSRKHVPVRI